MLKSLIVVGAQWGDEGKGKITNYLSERADIVVRYQGGNNAGHTVKFNGKEFHLQTIPSGIFNKNTLNIIANGMVVNPLALYDEMTGLIKAGFDCKNLVISSRANLDLEYHLALDGLKEAYLKDKKIGTTKKGIGPCYTDKISRDGIRFSDFIRDDFDHIYEEHLIEKNKEILKYNGEPIDLKTSLAKYHMVKDTLKPLVKDNVSILAKAKEENKKILFEGAQGAMLDVDFGTYPYVTSSNTTSGGAISGSGIGLGYVEGVLGIVKAYTTRVGEGPFVTEQNNEFGNTVREKAHEYGVVTHRPRRVGYLDLVQLNFSKNINGFKYIALMLLDILGNMNEIKVCTAYKLDGKEIDYYPADLDELSRVEPVYKTFKSWKEDISSCHRFDELPREAKDYIKFIENYLNVKSVLISVGPSKEQTIIAEEIF
jgi:adenylosuccinate synthase